MTKKLTLRSLVVAGTLSACVGLAAAAIPAEASTYFTLLGTASSWSYQCIPGTQYGVLPTNIGGVHHVNNGCGGRVYLYQYKGGGGWSYCISPHAAYASVPSSRSSGAANL
jgi:hypothetical protein